MAGNLKKIYVRVPGAGTEAGKATEIGLEPGAKASDVLNKLSLNDYQLFKDNAFLTPDANVYDLLPEGSTIDASPKKTHVGR